MPMRPPVHRPYKLTAQVKPRPSAAARGYGGEEWEATRKRILKRDKWTCLFCGRNLAEKGARPNVDHIVEKRDGGTDDDSNLRTLCPSCHSERTAKESGGFGNPKRHVGGGAMPKTPAPKPDDFYVA